MNHLLLTAVGSIFILGGAAFHAEGREQSLLICEQEPAATFSESVTEKQDSSSVTSPALSDSSGRASLSGLPGFEWDTPAMDTGETIVLTSPPAHMPVLLRGGPTPGEFFIPRGLKIEQQHIFTATADAGRLVTRGIFLRPISGGYKSQGIHDRNAVDLAIECGRPVMAAATGTVQAVGTRGLNGGYGRYVIIEHERGILTLYAHLSQVLVTVGQYVEQGFPIGLVGTTGNSTGCHLHFEVRGAKNPF